MNILYFSYDSVNDPIVKSQVLPILEYFKKKRKIFLLSFEISKTKKINKNHHILKYKNFLSFKIIVFLYSIFFMYKLCKKNNIKIVITRSYVPQIITVLLKYFSDIKIIFDIRGFWFDEKKDFNSINLLSYYILKKIERFLFKKADRILTLSKISKNYISKKFGIKTSKIRNVTTFTNLEKIKFLKKKKSNKIRLAYIGGLKNSYDFLNTIKFLKRLNNLSKNWHMTIFNIGQYEFFESVIKNYPELKKKIKYTNFLNNKNLSTILRNFDIGIYFIHTNFSKIASCPTKLGEFLASGTPVLTNPLIGDSENLIKKNKCGLIVNKKLLTSFSLEQILILKKISYQNNSRQTALKFFNSKKEIKKYDDLVCELSS